MKNILVTGGCGFIGSNFVRHLLYSSDFSGRIVNVDKLTYAGNLENLSGLDKAFPNRYIFVHADICDMERLKAIFELHDIDAVCHFAAESHVDRSIADADAFIQTNVVGTFRLLEIARHYKHRLERFHHISTDEVFGSLGTDGTFSEETPYRPRNPYSASKAGSDHLVRAYYATYGLPVTISNCSNNYGPYQFPEKLIPLMILNACEGKKLPVYGRGENIRDWLYVEDHCKAIRKIMIHGENGETYNIGGDCEIRNIEVVEWICDLLDERLPLENGSPRRELITFVKDRPGHDFRYAMDFAKIRNKLNWTPAESFESGMQKTVEWYLSNSDWVENVKTGEYRKWIARHYG